MGIGGISMSGFAELLHTEGFTITGSDSKCSEITKHLEAKGITILYGQKASNITSDIDLVVYTAAIHDDNPEMQEVIKRGIPRMDRAEMVGQVMLNYQKPVAISGTHGKTTTTSMISQIFLEGKLDPTISVGGILNAIGGNIRIGESENFITEACEYTNSFLKFNPKYGIILNIEEDHLDFFKDIHDIRHSFHLFAKRIPSDGILFINGEIDNYKEITSDLTCQVRTYGLSENPNEYTYTACNISYTEKGFGEYDLYHNGQFVKHILLSVVGKHNISNSLPAIGLSLEQNISIDDICSGLTAFHGTQRRFEHKGTINGVTIIDDYAHHPTEIKTTLEAAKRYPHKSIWCVFQPHTYTRTKAFLKDFAKALSIADKIVLTDIYAAREVDTGEISSKDLLQELKALNKEAYYFHDFKEIEKFLLEKCINGDLLITMGAGDVVNIGNSLLQK